MPSWAIWRAILGLLGRLGDGFSGDECLLWRRRVWPKTTGRIYPEDSWGNHCADLLADLAREQAPIDGCDREQHHRWLRRVAMSQAMMVCVWLQRCSFDSALEDEQGDDPAQEDDDGEERADDDLDQERADQISPQHLLLRDGDEAAGRQINATEMWPFFPWGRPSSGERWAMPPPPAFLGAQKGDRRTGGVDTQWSYPEYFFHAVYHYFSTLEWVERPEYSVSAMELLVDFVHTVGRRPESRSKDNLDAPAAGRCLHAMCSQMAALRGNPIHPGETQAKAKVLRSLRLQDMRGIQGARPVFNHREKVEVAMARVAWGTIGATGGAGTRRQGN